MRNRKFDGAAVAFSRRGSSTGSIAIDGQRSGDWGGP